MLWLLACWNSEEKEEPIVDTSVEQPTDEPMVDDTEINSEPTSEPTSEPDMATEPEEELPTRDGWVLVWHDEFNDSEIDLSKWSFEVNGWGGGNNELQYYTDRPNNARIEDGSLIIQANQERFTGSDGQREYTSARLRTLNQGDWLFGRMEARIQLPTGQGLWPAFWMLPTDWVYGGWAASGEIDIMELVGHEPNVVHGTLHYGGSWPENTYSGSGFTNAETFADDYHTFAVEWEENEIRWYVDEALVSTQNSWYSAVAAYPAPFNQRFHIILNIAVGGNWPGNPDASTVFPQQMKVDYVRVFQRDDEVAQQPPQLTLTLNTRCLSETVQTVALTGPWAGNWHPDDALVATDNGDGTWSVSQPLPTNDIEYLWVVNGQYESLIEDMQNGATCAPVTDYWNYANRVWSVGSGDQTVTYGTCTPCNQ